jgi:SIR2-like protein
VITRQDYLRYNDRHSALGGILQALLITREMLFVGFSLQDDNFHRLADDVRKALAGTVASGERFGTALFLNVDELTEMIWGDEIELLAAEDARRLDVFLDCVLYHATIGSAHMLDPSFAEMLSEGEAALADLLRPLASGRGQVTQLPAWQVVEEMLGYFGARVGPSDAAAGG